MKFTAGETLNITIGGNKLLIKVEDASKSDTVSARVEEVLSGSDYQPGQIQEFPRGDISE